MSKCFIYVLYLDVLCLDSVDLGGVTYSAHCNQTVTYSALALAYSRTRTVPGITNVVTFGSKFWKKVAKQKRVIRTLSFPGEFEKAKS